MLFDARAYLGQLDPDVDYEIDTLEGGVMNVTLRARKTSGDHSKGRFPHYSSLVLKFAPPYVAGMGEEVPLTTFRQNIEARALTLLADDTCHGLARVCYESSVQLPKVLYHDSNAHVLIMTDMGPLPNLASIFSELVGYIGTPSQERHASFERKRSDQAVAYYRAIGRKLGTFFAKLHSPRSLSTVLDDSTRGIEYLDNPQLGNFEFENIIKPVKDNLQLFPQFVSSADGARLYIRAVMDFESTRSKGIRAVSLLDCWPGAFLVNTHSEPSDPTVVVVDWEFACIGRGLNGDMARLLAQLTMLECAAQHRNDLEQVQQLKTLASAISETYYNHSLQEGSEWAARGPSLDSAEYKGMNPASVTTMRSAFLTYGVEIMHWSLVKPWNCEDPSCMVGSSHTTVKHDCKMVQSMVQRAIWYLQAAGDDDQQFCSANNLTNLRQVCQKGWWLVNLIHDVAR